MRLAVAATAAALLAACGPKASPHTSGSPPAPLTCDNVVEAPLAAIDGMVQDLGTLAVGATASFIVDPGTSSFFIVSQEVGQTAPATVVLSGTTLPNSVVPTNVRSPAPASTLYYDDFAAPPTVTIAGQPGYDDLTGLLAWDPGFQPVTSVFPFPSTSGGLQRLRSDGQVAPGTWTFTVNDWAYECLSITGCTGGSAAGRYHVYVVTVARPVPPPASTRTLDVEVYLATASTSRLPNVDAANASSDVVRWKQSLAYYLAQGGITLGQVTFNDLPSTVKAQYAPNGSVNVGSDSPCGNLSQLFTKSSAQARAVQVFLADVVVAPTVGGGSFAVIGVDGSIPGPSGFAGTISSGAIVGLEDFGFEVQPGGCSAAGAPNLTACGTDSTAYVTAHEIGHWLGLFHTTEQDGTLFDPISDTSVCPCHSCETDATKQAACAEVSNNPTTLVTNAVCDTGPTCGGGRNLMFWLLDDNYSTGELSADQAAVMQLNPAVQ